MHRLECVVRISGIPSGWGSCATDLSLRHASKEGRANFPLLDSPLASLARTGRIDDARGGVGVVAHRAMPREGTVSMPCADGFLVGRSPRWSQQRAFPRPCAVAHSLRRERHREAVKRPAGNPHNQPPGGPPERRIIQVSGSHAGWVVELSASADHREARESQCLYM